MASSLKHIRHQGPVIAALGRTALEALRQRIGRPSPPTLVPGPIIESSVAPRDAALVADYVRHVGGDPRAYAGSLPPHLFPQWGFGDVARTLIGIDYPLLKALNGGVKMVINAPIPDDEPLRLTSQLVGIDDNGRRALLHQTQITGTASAPRALEVDFYPIVPLRRAGKGKRDDKKHRGARQKPRVPADARELARWNLPARAGLDFAILTGDFNPIHWVRPAARASGFKNVILHGFSTLGRAIEGLNRALWDGDPMRLRSIDVRFTRPLVLPARVGLFVDGDGGVFVGDAPGEAAYLSGSYTTRDADDRGR